MSDWYTDFSLPKFIKVFSSLSSDDDAKDLLNIGFHGALWTPLDLPLVQLHGQRI